MERFDHTRYLDNRLICAAYLQDEMPVITRDIEVRSSSMVNTVRVEDILLNTHECAWKDENEGFLSWKFVVSEVNCSGSQTQKPLLFLSECEHDYLTFQPVVFRDDKNRTSSSSQQRNSMQ